MSAAARAIGATPDLAIGLALTLGWFAILAILTADVVAHYFPLADEWAIVADSHPSFADPASWFTDGFRDYFAPPPGVPHESGTTFLRPLFNLAYWLCGWFVAPESGAYLYLPLFAVGSCAGLTWMALRRLQVASTPALALAAAVPLLPSLLPALEPLIQPCMGFDAVAAGLTLLAYLSYTRERYGWSALWLILAVLTKETALPIAAALPAAYFLQQRSTLQEQPRRFAATLVLLAVPLALWLLARLLAFGLDASGQVYVLRSTGYDGLLRLLRLATKWPFWVDAGQLLHTPDLTAAAAARFALLAANACAMAAALALIGLRLWRRAPLRVEELCLLSSYAFLLLVGTSPRYGVLFDIFLLLCGVLWWRERAAPRPASRVVAAGLLVGVAISTAQATTRWPVLESNALAYAQAGRAYVAALRGFEPGQRVLVLNDPVTFWAPVHWLAQAMEIEAEVMKLADYPWSPRLLDGIAAPCEATLRASPGDPLTYEFTQTCGIDLLSSTRLLPGDQPVRLQREGGIEIALHPPAAEQAQTPDRPRWRSMRIELSTPDAVLLYFDPGKRGFVAMTPGDAAPRAFAGPEAP